MPGATCLRRCAAFLASTSHGPREAHVFHTHETVWPRVQPRTVQAVRLGHMCTPASARPGTPHGPVRQCQPTVCHDMLHLTPVTQLP
jgi:hypothetical protein